MGIISLSHAPFSVPATGEASNSPGPKMVSLYETQNYKTDSSHLADGRNPPRLIVSNFAADRRPGSFSK
jgi:hypothetical protein